MPISNRIGSHRMSVPALLILTAALLAGRIQAADDVMILPGDTSRIPVNRWPTIAALRGQDAFMPAVNSAPGLARLKSFAITEKRQEIVNRLFRHLISGSGQDSDVAYQIGKKPWDNCQPLLHWAASEGEADIVQFLLSAPGITANVVDSRLGRTPLHWATRQGQYITMELLLAARGIDVNARDIKQKTPLHLAVIFGHDDAVVALVHADNINVTAVDKDGKAPLQHAMEHWSADPGSLARQYIIMVLIAVGAGFGPMSDVTPLYWAVDHDYSNIVKMLLKLGGIDVNEGGGARSSPLCKAVMQNRHRLVEMLLEHEDIDANAGDPLLLAVQERHIGIAKMLAQHPKLVMSTGVWQAVQLAEQYGDSQLVPWIIAPRKLARSTTGLFKYP
ncbi:Ankyrin repeat domain-containing protein [Plasmodiophora brassicae]|uniref:Uncharacterized protein n=1 Tax=Plasmodiophora brassicae TaxID=37360 RepID=A0A0G4IZA7_PLABS|nr:hypothetical protein PBRA_001722 [Plasmodiophora brassicae]